MGEAGVATLVFSSSATVYGQPDRLPANEDAPVRPASVYGRTKRTVEDFLRDLARVQRQLAHRDPALLQPGGRASVRAHRRSAERPPEQPGAPAVPHRGGRVSRAADLRDRLADAGRYRHPRLPPRRRPGRRARRGAGLSRRARGRGDAEPRRGTRLFRAGGRGGLRAGVRAAGAQGVRAAPRGRRRVRVRRRHRARARCWGGKPRATSRRSARTRGAGRRPVGATRRRTARAAAARPATRARRREGRGSGRAGRRTT